MDRFVGGQAPAAGQYHSRDFEWDDVRREAEAALAAERAALPPAADQGSPQKTPLVQNCRMVLAEEVLN